MNTTPASPSIPDNPDAYILAGRNEDGVWHIVASETVTEDETADDVKTFLQTMAHAHSRNFLDLEIFKASEFEAHGGRAAA